jgi:hypothetical protein
MAGAVAGLALWLSLGSLDAVDGPGGALRVAMLPPLWLAAALAIAGAGASLALTFLVARLATGLWRTGEGFVTGRPEDADVVLPLFATGLLALPFLPWLPDLVPAWTALAGPFIVLVWLVTGGLVVRAALLRIGQARSWALPRLPFSPTLRVLIVSVTVTGAAAARLVGTPIFPGGDEPHYLVIAQSVWRDGDLRIENNHRRGDTLEYFSRPLKPDYLTRGVDRQIYSVHPIGVGVLLAPVYALGGYRGVVAFLVLVAALAATCAWRLAVRVTDARSARFGWLACAMTAPWVFNSFTVYPEVPAALAVIVSFSIAVGLNTLRDREQLLWSMAVCGLGIAVLPWLSSKYALMGAALGLITMARLWLPHWLQESESDTARAPARTWSDLIVGSLTVAAAPVVSGIAWLTFFKIVWGTMAPSAPYGNQHAMDLAFLAAGGPGLYFDQEYGVVSAAPVLLLALLGLIGMAQKGSNDRRLAIEIALVSVSLLVTVAAFHIWWGGTASVGRPLISALLLLVLPCAWQVRAWASLTTAAWVLLGVSLAITATLALALQGLLLVADRDGTSRLLDYWSPFWPLSSIGPTFITQSAVRGTLITAVWIACIAGGLALLRRARPDAREGRTGLTVAGAAFAALIVALVLTPFASMAGATSRLPSARVRSPLIDTFDASRRPVGLVFDPLRVVPARDLVSMVRLIAGPDLPRTAPAPSLLYQARWAWPAGEYEVTVRSGAAPLSGQLSLQAGRAGPPLITWTIAPGEPTWSGRVALPIDVGFIGFLASQELAAARPRLEIRPVAIVDASHRLPPLEVIQARTLGRTLVFFHDDNADPEGAGFWTRRDRSTRVTLAAAPIGATLRLRAGPAAIRAVVRLGRRTEVVDLSPDSQRDLPLPRGTGPQRLEIVTRGGFVPSERNPSVRDSRALGCWIEVTDGG